MLNELLIRDAAEPDPAAIAALLEPFARRQIGHICQPAGSSGSYVAAPYASY